MWADRKTGTVAGVVVALVAALLAAAAVSPELIAAQERGGEYGGGGDPGGGELPQVSREEKLGQLLEATQRAGEMLFRDIEERLLGRSAGEPRLGSVTLTVTPQGQQYVLGVIYEGDAVFQAGPGQDHSEGVLVWGSAGGREPLLGYRVQGQFIPERIRAFAKMNLRGTKNTVVWEAQSPISREWAQEVALRPNYIPRVVCVGTVDIESEGWSGFTPASEEGSLPTTLACVDLGLVAATGSPHRVVSWRIPGSVWRHEAAFKVQYRPSQRTTGSMLEGLNRHFSALNDFSALRARAARGPWMLWTVRARGRPGVIAEAVAVRDARPGQPVLEVSMVNAHASPPAELFEFTQERDGAWRGLLREVRRDGSMVEGRPSLVERSGNMFAVCCGKPYPAGGIGIPGSGGDDRRWLPQRHAAVYPAVFADVVWVAVDVSQGEAIVIKGKSCCPKTNPLAVRLSPLPGNLAFGPRLPRVELSGSHAMRTAGGHAGKLGGGGATGQPGRESTTRNRRVQP